MSLHARRAAVAVGIAACVAVGGCGGNAAGQGQPLGWIGTPQVFTPRDLPRDRVVIGRIRNESLRTIRLQASALRVRDSRGWVMKSSAGFTAGYAHGLFGGFQQPSALPERELVRLGRMVVLNPGAATPVFAAWRLPADAHGPVSIDYGTGILTVP